MKRCIIGLLVFLVACRDGTGNAPITLADNTIPVAVVNVLGPDSLSFTELTAAFAWGEFSYSTTPWRLKLESYYETTMEDIGTTNYKDWEAEDVRIMYCRAWAKKNVPLDIDRPVYFFWPPLLLNGWKGFGGMAMGGDGKTQPVAIGNGSAFSSPFDGAVHDRLYASGGVVMAHELGHLIGMSHYDPSPNVMATNASHFFDSWWGKLRFLDFSINEALTKIGARRLHLLHACMKKFKTKIKRRDKCIARVNRYRSLVPDYGESVGY
jgi:hypothetical protein